MPSLQFRHSKSLFNQDWFQNHPFPPSLNVKPKHADCDHRTEIANRRSKSLRTDPKTPNFFKPCLYFGSFHVQATIHPNLVLLIQFLANTFGTVFFLRRLLKITVTLLAGPHEEGFTIKLGRNLIGTWEHIGSSWETVLKLFGFFHVISKIPLLFPRLFH